MTTTTDSGGSGLEAKQNRQIAAEPGIDVMITHGPPAGILDTTAHGDVGCDHLLRAVGRTKPKLHCFGHIHESWGCFLKDWTGHSDGNGHDDKNPDAEESGVPSNNGKKGDEGERIRYASSDWSQIVGERCVYVDATKLKAGQETLFVNASIMDLEYRPTNAPWLVDVMLPLGAADEEEEEEDDG